MCAAKHTDALHCSAIASLHLFAQYSILCSEIINEGRKENICYMNGILSGVKMPGRTRAEEFIKKSVYICVIT